MEVQLKITGERIDERPDIRRHFEEFGKFQFFLCFLQTHLLIRELAYSPHKETRAVPHSFGQSTIAQAVRRPSPSQTPIHFHQGDVFVVLDALSSIPFISTTLPAEFEHYMDASQAVKRFLSKEYLNIKVLIFAFLLPWY
jgi:hypothetical protein